MGNNQNIQTTIIINNTDRFSIDNQEYIQETYICCCCCKKKSYKRKLLTWEINFLENCNQLRSIYSWPLAFIDIVNNQTFSRTDFMKEINDLRLESEYIIKQPDQILVNPSQLGKFKNNLKSSVLLSYSDSVRGSFASISRQNTSPLKIHKQIIQKRQSMSKFSRNSTILQNFRKLSAESRVQEMVPPQRSVLRQSLLSLVDDTLSSMIKSQKQISKQNAKSLQIFIKFTVILEKHFNNKQNPFCKFHRCFNQYLKKAFNINLHNKIVLTENVIQIMMDNIRQYLFLLRGAIYDFYSLSIFSRQTCSNSLIPNQQNLLIVLTAILFKNRITYQLIFNLVKLYNKQRETQFTKILAEIKCQTPQFFDVKAQYCLTASTLKGVFQDVSVESQLQNLDISDLASQKQQPYAQCIATLKNLSRTKSPISKMKVIMQCSQNIIECIRKFYQHNKLKLKHQLIDADQILSIFCYIIANAKIQNLHTHLFILQHFATDLQLISQAGYYYSVLLCAVQQIERGYKKPQHISNIQL